MYHGTQPLESCLFQPEPHSDHFFSVLCSLSLPLLAADCGAPLGPRQRRASRRDIRPMARLPIQVSSGDGLQGFRCLGPVVPVVVATGTPETVAYRKTLPSEPVPGWCCGEARANAVERTQMPLAHCRYTSGTPAPSAKGTNRGGPAVCHGMASHDVPLQVEGVSPTCLVHR